MTSFGGFPQQFYGKPTASGTLTSLSLSLSLSYRVFLSIRGNIPTLTARYVVRAEFQGLAAPRAVASQQQTAARYARLVTSATRWGPVGFSFFPLFFSADNSVHHVGPTTR